jgi:hypothetical protein
MQPRSLPQLEGAGNVSGIYTDGTSFSTGGIDGYGYAYSSMVALTAMPSASVTMAVAVNPGDFVPRPDRHADSG